MTVDYGDGRDVAYAAADLLDLDHAYCLTVHRAQGSEWPGVVLLASSSSGGMLTRNLLYTALTRARKAVVVIGDQEAIARAVAETRDTERLTGWAWPLVAEHLMATRSARAALPVGGERRQYGDLVRQYLELRDENPGIILLFRIGTFYEALFEDAELVSDALGLKLSDRPSGRQRAARPPVRFHPSCAGYLSAAFAGARVSGGGLRRKESRRRGATHALGGAHPHPRHRDGPAPAA